MKISIASAVHGQTGNTTIAQAVAHALSLSQKKNICLTHTDFGNNILFGSLGVTAVEDITGAFSHLVKMLNHNVIQPSEVPDYAIHVFDGLDLYSANKVTLDMAELLSFYEVLLTKMTVYSHIIIDVDSGIRSEVSKLALEVSDVIIIPVNHNQAVLEASKQFKSEILSAVSRSRRRDRKDLQIYYLLNQYNPDIASYKKVATTLGVRPSKLMTLHYNPELIKATNAGRISDALVNALMNRKSVVNLREDLKQICKVLLGKDFTWKLQTEKEGK